MTNDGCQWSWTRGRRGSDRLLVTLSDIAVCLSLTVAAVNADGSPVESISTPSTRIDLTAKVPGNGQLNLQVLGQLALASMPNYAGDPHFKDSAYQPGDYVWSVCANGYVGTPCADAVDATELLAWSDPASFGVNSDATCGSELLAAGHFSVACGTLVPEFKAQLAWK